MQQGSEGVLSVAFAKAMEKITSDSIRSATMYSGSVDTCVPCLGLFYRTFNTDACESKLDCPCLQVLKGAVVVKYCIYGLEKF